MEKKTTDLINLIVENKESPIANKVANMIGLQVVDRNGKVYVRKIPERLTGKALNSAIKFGEINHNNKGKTGVILLPNGAEQNKVAFQSAKEFTGNKFVKPLTEKEKIEALLVEVKS